MDEMSWICPMLADDQRLRPVSKHIWSAFPANQAGAQKYDRRAAVYDRLVGSRIYNRLMWGTSPEQYTAFAREASVGQGPLLDAGCGTMSATFEAYRRSNRVVIGVDLSVPMLELAATRLHDSSLIAMVQADLTRLPFACGTFETVICMGMLHLFPNPQPYLRELRRVLAPRGRLYTSTLVRADRAIGDRYLRVLERAGEVAPPRTQLETVDALSRVGKVTRLCRDGNMLFAVTEALK